MPYPVQYVYDSDGRRTEMHTYRADAGFDGSTWPTGATGDVTQWVYDDATGQLLAKVDAAGQAVSYEYGAGGRLLSRTWARDDNESNPLVTTYGYDAATGELLTVTYSDATPDVAYTYDRLGRQVTVADGAGTRTFAYNASTLQLTSETITGIAPATITRQYASSGVAGRATGLTVGGYSVQYGFDGVGRMNNVSWNVRGNQDAAAYSYVPSSDLLAGYTTTSGLGVSYAYETQRDLKTQVRTQHGSTVISQYDYAYDSIGRRESVAQSGSAFAGNRFTQWGYDERNQVVSSQRHAGIDDTGAPVTAEARSYQYDPIGNRVSALDQDGVTSIAYAANALNQYTEVGAQPLTHDEDGNLLNDGSKTLTYNAENQLVSVTVPGVSVSTYVYDYLGRRVRKIVDVLSGDDYTVTWTYDGWNPVREQRVQGGATTTKHYVWGMDLGQSLQAAGGIGGLIAVVGSSGEASLFAYDGNGNVSDVIAATEGNVAAHYEYDAFGNVTLESGLGAGENAYRFSTKYADDETGLVYYGYRFYEPVTGRWVNRDPIGTSGGFNVYAFVINAAVYLFDIAGRFPSAPGPWDPGDEGLPRSPYDWLRSGSGGGGGIVAEDPSRYLGTTPGMCGAPGATMCTSSEFPTEPHRRPGFYDGTEWTTDWTGLSPTNPPPGQFRGKLARSQAWRRYGRINQDGVPHDPANWPNHGDWMVDFRIPDEVLRNKSYRLAYTGPHEGYPGVQTDARGRVVGFKINKDLRPLLEQAFLNLARAHQLCYLKGIQSTWNMGRLDPGKSGPSAHAYGLAFDLNPGDNPRGPTHVFGSKLVNAFTDAGIHWGYWFSDDPDPHHFGLGW